jgi:raffinose/stachyose/melibiose transport system permease protein
MSASPSVAIGRGPIAARLSAAGLDRGSLRHAVRSGRLTVVVLFLPPALLLFTLFVVIPVMEAGWYSAFNWNGYGRPTNWVGWQNYAAVVQTRAFVLALRNNGLIILVSLLVQLPLALALALLLAERFRGAVALRMLFFMPYVLAEIATGLIFSFVYDGDYGLLAAIYRLFGAEAPHLLASPSTAMAAILVVVVWKYFGFHMMLYLAGLQSIPAELTEAALIDGASAWQRFRNVTLPLLAPTLRISVFLAVIGSIQLFDLVWVITQGGPDHHSETMAVTMFQFGFKRYQVGYASAVSVVMFGISLVFALAYQRFVLRRDLEGATTTMRGGGK